MGCWRRWRRSTPGAETSVIELCAVGPRLFLTETQLPRDEIVLWQEGGQILLLPIDEARPYSTLRYAIHWEANEPARVAAALTDPQGAPLGAWTASVEGETVALSFSLTCPGPDPWPAVEAFFCHKHRSAPTFYDPELRRTYLEWDGEPVSVRDRLEAMYGPGSFWPKNHLHRVGCGACFDRYDRVGLRNPASAGWANHRDATTGGWMAIVAADGAWVSGIFWEGAQILAQNGPDYGCLHAGASLGERIAPGQRVHVRGTAVLGRIGLEGFLARYRAARSAAP